MHDTMTLAPGFVVCATCTTWSNYVLATECRAITIEVVREPALQEA